MNQISDWLTHIDNKEDEVYLRSKLLPVNIRLFRVNKDYRAIILACCDHISKVALAGFAGYKLPHGTSGANCAIPFNIIAVVLNRGKPDARAMVMINPIIVQRSKEMEMTQSNCGSIRLEKPISVARHQGIAVSWYNTKGVEEVSEHYPLSQSFTIQHEIDHNQGILITDREIKSNG